MIKRVGYLLISLLSLAALFLPASQALAASATLYLSPSSGSVVNGDTISVGIRENSGSQAVNGVRAYLAYPSSLFDVANIISSSSFSIIAQNNYGNGSIQLDRGALPSVSGDQLVATVVFKAKASSGTAGVSFASGSQVAADDGSGTNILSGTSGGNYSLTAAASSGSGSTGSSGTSPGSTSSKNKSTSPSNTTPGKDTTPPAISAVKVQSTTTTTATITWVTTEPATSQVDYGVNNGYGLVAVDSNLVTDHKLTLNSPIISPGATYHFVVKSIDPAGNAASGQDTTFKTQGGVLKATVLNQNKKPVAGALVSFSGQAAKTDKNGQATISYLPAGLLNGTVTYKGNKTAETVDVKTADPAKPQAVTFRIKTSPISPLILIIPVVGLLAGAIYLLRNRGSVPPSDPFYATPIPRPGPVPISPAPPDAAFQAAPSPTPQAVPTPSPPNVGSVPYGQPPADISPPATPANQSPPAVSQL